MSARAAAASLLREALPDISWRRGVNVRRETFAGSIGAVLAIPQAIIFAYLVGLPPEYGLYCAAFVAFIASLFGSAAMVSGPNTAVSILLGLTVVQFAGRGSPLYTDCVLILSLMVGLIQLGIWLVRGAELFRYFSPAAITGIKAGVGILLITSALEGSLGLSPLTSTFFYEKFYVVIWGWNELVNPYAATISAITIVGGLAMRKRWPRTYIINALLLGSVTGALIVGYWGPVDSQVELLGRVSLQAFPLMWPRVSPEYWVIIEGMFPNAVAIAVLGLTQSLVIARDLKTHAVNTVDLHKETFAQGLANVLSPFFSTFAGSGSFNRTNVAMEMGAKTPLAGMVGAVAVLLIAYVLGPLLTYLPMPALAGILALVGIGMIRWKEARPFLQHRMEGAVYSITIFAVTFLGLDVGIFLAALVSIIFFIAGASKVAFDIERKDGLEHIAVKGNLFYASLDRLSQHLHANPANDTVLDLRRVSYCDSSAYSLFDTIMRERLQHGGKLDVIAA